MEFPDEDTDDSAPPVSEPRKLFIGNLSWNTTDETLGNAFADYGRISAKVVVDRFNGRSRGFGFVEFDEPEDATLALEHMDGKELDGREIRVDRATKRLNNRRYN